MPEPAPLPPSRSQELFRKAPPEVKALLKNIMAKERSVQHMRNRQAIYQDLLTYIRESAQ